MTIFNLTLIDRDGNKEVLKGITEENVPLIKKLMAETASAIGWKKPFIISKKRLP